MKPVTGIGCFGWVITMTKLFNGFYMDTLPDYSELHVTSNFSFLRGGSHPEELVMQAAALGYRAIAINDHNTFAGLVRAHVAAKKARLKFIPSCRLVLQDGASLLAFPKDQAAYSRLSTLLTIGNLRAEKGRCELYKADVYAHAQGCLFILLPPSELNERFDFDDLFIRTLAEYREAFGQSLFLGATKFYQGTDAKFLHRLSHYAIRYDVPLVATNDVYYHDPGRRELFDVITCVREKCTISTAGFRLNVNAERYLKSASEMHRLFRHYPDALRQTQLITEACQFSLDQLTYRYPKEVTPDGSTSQEALVRLTWLGAQQIFGIVPDKIKANIEYELKFIAEMNYAEYFLTVYDIVRFARERKILCQGRGSAANSTVCYCLGITSVDPSKFDLLFERFISSARNEPPDIDVDFEHERREEVMQYIYAKYGRDRAAVVATVTQQHHKGAIRDVGKAMGLSVDTISRLSGLIWDFKDEGFDRNRILSQGINPDDRTIKKVLELTCQFMGFPRQLGQHTGGFVISDGKLSELCPILHARMEDRTNIEWNKDDIDALGFMKIDVLALGMLTCIRKAFDLVRQHYGRELTLANIPQDDPAVYEMVTHADTIGVFQIESRAQMSMLPRLKPTCFYDLVIEVAIVRPGPIQGDMVHPYLRRRNGEEPVEYPSEALKEILGRTLGVPLFQEQAMKIAIVAAGFSPAEADLLRRSMATFKVNGMIAHFEDKLITGMVANGYSKEYAKRVFRQLEGFGSYGFPESHAVSFALLVYVSAWLKCYYPDVFTCALLNSLPMGFYQPAQLVQDAQRHGVVVLPVDINYSRWDNLLELHESKFAIRLGLRQVKGLKEADAQQLFEQRGLGYRSLHALREAGLSNAVLELLSDADAFRSVGLDRRAALWEATVKDYQPEALFSRTQTDVTEPVELPEMPQSEHVIQDYQVLTMSLKGHPVSFLRESLKQLGVTSHDQLKTVAHDEPVKVAGLILVRQRPGTAKGICFITLEDETGSANLVIFPQLFDRYRKEIIQSRLLLVEGKLQREGEVIHVIVQKCVDASRMLKHLMLPKDSALGKRSRSDETTSKGSDPRNKSDVIQTSMFSGGRNFK
jgi:error-prone DNA polymerase